MQNTLTCECSVDVVLHSGFTLAALWNMITSTILSVLIANYICQQNCFCNVWCMRLSCVVLSCVHPHPVARIAGLIEACLLFFPQDIINWFYSIRAARLRLLQTRYPDKPVEEVSSYSVLKQEKSIVCMHYAYTLVVGYSVYFGLWILNQYTFVYCDSAIFPFSSIVRCPEILWRLATCTKLQPTNWYVPTRHCSACWLIELLWKMQQKFQKRYFVLDVNRLSYFEKPTVSAQLVWLPWPPALVSS